MQELRGLAMAVALLAALQPLSAEATGCQGGYYPTVDIGGDVAKPKTYTLAELQAKAASKLNVAFFSGSSGMQTYAFTGVPLIDLLTEAGIVTDPDQKNDNLRKYVIVTASDCYQAALSLAELLPTFGGDPVMVAYSDGTGAPLPAGQGMARLVVPGDKSGGRYVSNIVRIAVRSPGPGPQTKH